MAAKELGLEAVPCIVLGHLSPKQKRAYVIADNKLALNAGWDPVLLTEHLVELDAIDFDITLTGFSPEEFAALTAKRNAGHTDPDETPEAPADPVTELGDVWVLGKHRILCDDSTDAARRRESPRRRQAAPDGDRPALRGEIRPGLARGPTGSKQAIRRRPLAAARLVAPPP